MWTEDQETRLRELAADPALSHSGIAAKLNAEFSGMGLTRNAVIGKCHRMEIVRPEERRGPGARTMQTPRVRRRKPKATWLDEYLPKRIPAPGYGAFAGAAVRLGPGAPAPAAAPLISLLALKPRHCRWPVGDPPNVMFCGAERCEPLSYCILHARSAYRASPTRR